MVDRYPGLRVAALGVPWGLLRGALRAPRPEPPRGVSPEQLYGIVPICAAAGSQVLPDVHGEAVVWEDWRNDPDGRQTPDAADNADIYAWDPSGGERAVCTAPLCQWTPAVYGDTVVWHDLRTPGGIRAWDPVQGERWVAPGSAPDIHGDTIVFEGAGDSTGADIRAWDPVRGEWTVCAAANHQEKPAIGSVWIVWVDYRQNAPGVSYVSEVWGWRRNPGAEVRITPFSGDHHDPVTSGDAVVWSNGGTVYLRSSPVDKPIGYGTHPGVWQSNVWGGPTVLVYATTRNSQTSGSDIYAWDAVNAERPVCDAPGDQRSPAISGSTIVWEDEGDIYAYFGWDAADEHAVKIQAGPTGAPNPVPSGGTVQCGVTAVCTQGHTVTYAWSATDAGGDPAGTLDGPATATPTWTAPLNTTTEQAAYALRVTATCAEGKSAEGSYVQWVAPQQTLRVTLEAVPNPTRDLDGATVLATATLDGQPAEGVDVTISQASGDSAFGFDDDGDPFTAPVAQVSGTTDRYGHFLASWVGTSCLFAEATFALECEARAPGANLAAAGCELVAEPFAAVPYLPGPPGRQTIQFPSGRNYTWVSLRYPTDPVQTGGMMDLELEVGRTVSLDPLDLATLPVFRNTPVGAPPLLPKPSAQNVLLLSLPDTVECSAQAVEEGITCEALLRDWVPLGDIVNLSTFIGAVGNLSDLDALAKGQWIGLAIGQVPNLLQWLGTLAYGADLGCGPDGPAFDWLTEGTSLFPVVFGSDAFGVEGFRLHVPLRINGKGSGEVNVHVAYSYTTHNQWVFNTAGAQFTPLRVEVVQADLNEDGKVDARDCAAFAEGWRRAHGPAPAGEPDCDVDGDGDVDAHDARCLLSLMLSQAQ